MAEIGFEFSDVKYNRERYDEMREISLEMLEKMTDVPIKKIIPIIEERNGYRTPKVDVRSVVFNDKD